MVKEGQGMLVVSMRCCDRCAAEKGEEDEACKFYQRSYRSLCPGEWVRLLLP